LNTKIVVVGTGYVGLVAAVCFARKYDVVCVDTDERKVENINSGKAPFFEPELDDLLTAVHNDKRISATTNLSEAMHDADFVFISVGTPSLHSGAIDLSFVESAAADIGAVLRKINKYVIVIQRSTVVPTTTSKLVQATIERKSGKTAGVDFGIAFVPEFLREGSAVDDFIEPDRVVIGTQDEKVKKALFNLYSKFHEELPSEKIISMSIESAELVKYASNAFLATKISFANEIATLAEVVPGVDVNEVMAGVGLDHRINPRYFQAGAGFGGSCFPKDLNALVHFSRTHAIEPIMLEAVLERNRRQVLHIVDIAENALVSLADKRIAILGLSFKPNTSDMREAPSVKVISELIERGAGTIVGCDPVAIPEAQKIFGDRILYEMNPQQAIKGADCAIALTEWQQFMSLSPDDFLNSMRLPILIDARRIFKAEIFEKRMKYIAIGRGA